MNSYGSLANGHERDPCTVLMYFIPGSSIQECLPREGVSQMTMVLNTGHG